MRGGLAVVAAVLALLSVPSAGTLQNGATASNDARYRSWTVYGGGPDQIRYSSLAQINRSNVRELDVAWTFDSKESGGLQTNPIIVNDVLYTTTPSHKVVALEAATGMLRWRFDSGIEGRGPNRGVTYWASDREERLFVGQGAYLYALGPKSGRPIPQFGRDGRVDLREGLGREAAAQSVVLTTPGVVYKDLLIVGGRVSEGFPSSPGDIRAYDVRTGSLRWAFHTIPHPGEVGHDTWSVDAWRNSGGANNWAGMAVDVERGLVFVPTGSAAPDFYGASRTGDNLFANSLLALNAETGERVWHFQVVRHDLWDRDLPAPPSLVRFMRNGTPIDAVAQTTKHGHLYVFDRATGNSLFPIEYGRYPASTVDGERSSKTQPIPTRPAPFARQQLTEEMLTRRTPGAHKAALETFRTLRGGGQFVPFGVGSQTIVFPGFDGGAEWGGSAFDPATAILYVNANEMAWTGGLAPSESGRGGSQIYARECAGCHRDDRQGAPPQIPTLVGVTERRSPAELNAVIRQGAGRMPAFPNLPPDAVDAVIAYLRSGRVEMESAGSTRPGAPKYRFTGYRKFLDPDGYPAITPPWGTLNAIHVGTGEHVWTVPLGEYPELASQGVRQTGSENYGGPIVTAGGLVFIGATSFDRKFRAFDKSTGALLWETTLQSSAIGTPATYEVGGRQFVVVPAGGGKDSSRALGGGSASGGLYVAYALPQRGLPVR